MVFNIKNTIDALDKTIAALNSVRDLTLVDLFVSAATYELSATVENIRFMKDDLSQSLPPFWPLDVSIKELGECMEREEGIFAYARNAITMEVKEETFAEFQKLMFPKGEDNANVRADARETISFGSQKTNEAFWGGLVVFYRELDDLRKLLKGPSEETIERSWANLIVSYNSGEAGQCEADYKAWKVKKSSRVLKKALESRRTDEVGKLKRVFADESEFEQIFDSEKNCVDYDGLARIIFSSLERYKDSSLSNLLDCIHTIEMIDADLADLEQGKNQKAKSKKENPAIVEAREYVHKIDDFATDGWKGKKLNNLWEKIFKQFEKEISDKGKQKGEFKFSKKKVVCIISYLRKNGVYEQTQDKNYMISLEGNKINSQRKYLGLGLSEIPDLEDAIKTFLTPLLK